jgi:hypothetical protein
MIGEAPAQINALYVCASIAVALAMENEEMQNSLCTHLGLTPSVLVNYLKEAEHFVDSNKNLVL